MMTTTRRWWILESHPKEHEETQVFVNIPWRLPPATFEVWLSLHEEKVNVSKVALDRVHVVLNCVVSAAAVHGASGA